MGETKKWGGVRPGAGRAKEKNPRVSLTIQILPILDERVRAEAQKRGVSISRVCEDLMLGRSS